MRVFLAVWIGDVPPLRQKRDYVRGVSADSHFRSRTALSGLQTAERTSTVGSLGIRYMDLLNRNLLVSLREIPDSTVFAIVFDQQCIRH